MENFVSVEYMLDGEKVLMRDLLRAVWKKSRSTEELRWCSGTYLTLGKIWRFETFLAIRLRSVSSLIGSGPW